MQPRNRLYRSLRAWKYLSLGIITARWKITLIRNTANMKVTYLQGCGGGSRISAAAPAMGVGRILSRGKALGDFSKNSPRRAKSGEICFLPLVIRKQPFLLKFSKSRGGNGPSCHPLPMTTTPAPSIWAKTSL